MKEAAAYIRFQRHPAFKFYVFPSLFGLIHFMMLLQAAMLNSQTLEEVARLEMVHLMCFTEIGAIFFCGHSEC